MSRNLKDISTNNLQRYRKERCLCQRELTKLMGLKYKNDIYRWEAGHRLPSLLNALKLSVALNCPVEILFLDLFKAVKEEMAFNKLE